MRKAIALILVLMLALSLVACGGGAGAPASSVNTEPPAASGEIESGEMVEIVWAMQGAANEIEGWQAVADTANELLEAENIKIVIQKINTSSWDEYYQKITAQIAGGNSPDIGRIAESLMPTVISKKQVLDITAQVEADIDKSQYFESVFNNAGSQDGKTYGLPSGIYHKLVYYNKDLFDAAGLDYPSSDWNNPSSLEEIAEMSKILSNGEGVDRTYGFYAETDIFMVGAFTGEGIYNSNNTYQITDKHRETYAILDQMLNADKSMPTPVDTKIMGGFDMFRAGKLAMVCDGTWWHQTARDIEEFNVGIAAVPALDGSGHAVSFIDNYVVWSGTEHPEEAWKALRAIFSEECFNVLAATGNGGIPINRNTLEAHEADLIGTRFDDASTASFIQSLDFTWAMPYNDLFNEVSQQTNSLLEPWMVGTKSLDTALEELDSTLANITQ